MTSWAEIVAPSFLLQNTSISRRPAVTNFADIINIKDSINVNKVKRTRKDVSESNFCLYLPI